MRANLWGLVQQDAFMSHAAVLSGQGPLSKGPLVVARVLSSNEGLARGEGCVHRGGSGAPLACHRHLPSGTPCASAQMALKSVTTRLVFLVQSSRPQETPMPLDVIKRRLFPARCRNLELNSVQHCAAKGSYDTQQQTRAVVAKNHMKETSFTHDAIEFCWLCRCNSRL